MTVQEVQGYYEQGMEVPEDITLLWSDDKYVASGRSSGQYADRRLQLGQRPSFPYTQ